MVLSYHKSQPSRCLAETSGVVYGVDDNICFILFQTCCHIIPGSLPVNRGRAAHRSTCMFLQLPDNYTALLWLLQHLSLQPPSRPPWGFGKDCSGLRMIAELFSCEYYTILAPPLLPSPVILDLMWIPGHHSILLYLLSPHRTRSDLLLLFATVLDWSCAFAFIDTTAFECGIIDTIVCFINNGVIGGSTLRLGHLESTLIYVKITIANLNEFWSAVPAAVTVKITGFWDLMPCSLLDNYRCVRRTCYL